MSFDYYPIFANPHLALYNTASMIVAAVLLDALLGEPKRWHPLVGFGWLANRIEYQLNNRANDETTTHSKSALYLRMFGLLSWLLLLAPLIVISHFATHSYFAWLVNVLLLYFCIGAQSLKQHAQQIYVPLSQHNFDAARHSLSMIVSRDTSHLNETEIATASVESVLENANDAIFGAIFWFMLLGGTGALMFRLANTLDAMWGYRTPRFLYFGWAAARLDDVLNLMPARLTAFSYAVCGHPLSAIKCWITQANTWYSPNAGPVMAAGAGALNVKLGGAAMYHGQIKTRPLLGVGESATSKHIVSAIQLVNRSLFLWCSVIMIIPTLRNIALA